MSDTRAIRVFISSPGDVAEERVILRQTLERIGQEYRGILNIESFMWENEALFATADFQSQIDERLQPRDADIAVFVLWSRLGTPLPRSITREDGSRYDSGTEYEFENAKNAFDENNHPKILVYRKSVAPMVELNDTDALVEKIEQQKKLDQFFRKHFFDEEDDALTGAFTIFADSAEFEDTIFNHLSNLIRQELTDDMLEQLESQRSWQGSPYRGLEHFEREHAAIFFGRTRQVTEIIGLLKQRNQDNNPFVMLLGMSGVGKSSLVNAGIVPMLEEPDVIEGVNSWRHIRFKPADNPNDLFLGLADAICRDDALGSFTDRALMAQEMKLDASAFAERISFQLSKAGEGVRVLMFIDQFEELFTQDLEESDRRQFTDVIQALVQQAGVWTICAMRSDSFPKVQALPAMVSLRAKGGDKDLLPPSPSELQQIIRLPAQMAGLHFEADDEGVTLDQVLADQAVTLPEGLPLLEFSLEQLYLARTETGEMTYSAYDDIGGLSGSIANKAEEVVAALPSDVRDELPNMLIKMVSVDPQSGTAHRKPVLVEALAPSDAMKSLMSKLTDSRLIVSSLDAEQSPIINLVHESLLRNWPRVQMFIANEREFLVARAQLEQAAVFWMSESEPENLLLREGTVLQRAIQIRANYDTDLDNTTIRFIDQSERSFRHLKAQQKLEEVSRGRRFMFFSGLAASLLVLFGAIGFYTYNTNRTVIAAELDDANRRLISKATSFSRLSNVYRERGDWLNALLLSLDAARLVTNADNLSLVYENLTAYDKLDVNRQTLATSKGDRVFAESIDGGVIFRDVSGHQAYLRGLENFEMKEDDHFWISRNGSHVVIYRSEGGFDLLETSTSETVTDFAMVTGSVAAVVFDRVQNEVLLTRMNGNHLLIQLDNTQRLDIPSKDTIVKWHWNSASRQLLLLSDQASLALFDASSLTTSTIAEDVNTFTLSPGNDLVLLTTGHGQEVWHLPTNKKIHRNNSDLEELMFSGNLILSLWQNERISFINPLNPKSTSSINRQFDTVWPTSRGAILFDAGSTETVFVSHEQQIVPLPITSRFEMMPVADPVILIGEDNSAFIFDAETFSPLHRITPPLSVEPELIYPYLIYRTPTTIQIVDVNDGEVRFSNDQLNEQTPYIVQSGYLFIVDNNQNISQIQLGSFDASKVFAHHNTLVDISFDIARGVIFGIDEYGFQHAWEATQSNIVNQIPAVADMVEVPSDDYIGYWKDNYVEVRHRFNNNMVIAKTMTENLVAAALLPRASGLIVATEDGRISRIDLRGRETTLYHHRGSVNLLHIEGDRLFSGGVDGFARVFDLTSDKIIHEIRHWDAVNNVKPVGDDLVASTTIKGHLHVFSESQDRLVLFKDFKTPIEDIGDIDGQVVVALKEDDLAEALMIDSDTDEFISRLPASLLEVRSTLVSLDQSRAFVATLAEPMIEVNGVNRSVRGFNTRLAIVNLDTNEIIQSSTLLLPVEKASSITDGAWLADASFAPDSSSIVLVSTTGDQYFWNFDKKTNPSIVWDERNTRTREYSPIVQVDFSQSGQHIISRLATRDQVAWDVQSMQLLDQVPGERLVVGQRVQDVHVEPGKFTRVLALNADGNTETLYSVDEDLRYIKLDKGRRLLFQQDETTLVMWDLTQGSQLMALNSDKPFKRIFWPGGGRYLVTTTQGDIPQVREIPAESLINYGERLALGGF
jgi:WD40 repeat protein